MNFLERISLGRRNNRLFPKYSTFSAQHMSIWLVGVLVLHWAVLADSCSMPISTKINMFFDVIVSYGNNKRLKM